MKGNKNHFRFAGFIACFGIALLTISCKMKQESGEEFHTANTEDKQADPTFHESAIYEESISSSVLEAAQWYEIDAADYDTSEYFFVNNIRYGVFTSEITTEDEADLQQEDQNKENGSARCQDTVFSVIEGQKYVYLEDSVFENTAWIDGNPCRIAFYWCEYQGNICIAADMDAMGSGEYVWMIETMANQTEYVLASVNEKQGFEAAYFLCDLKGNEMIDLNQQFLADGENAGIEEIDSVYEMLWNGEMNQAIVECSKKDRIFYWNRETHELSDLQDKLGEAKSIKLSWIAENQAAVGILYAEGEQQRADVFLFDTQKGEWTQVISGEYHYRPSYTDTGIYFGLTENALYFHATGEVSLCDLSTGEKRPIDGVNVQDTVWMTDGMRAIFSDQNRRLLWLVDLQTGEVRQIAWPEQAGDGGELHFYEKNGAIWKDGDRFIYTG